MGFIGPRIHRGYVTDHYGAIGNLARAFSDIAAQLTPLRPALQIIVAGGSRLAGKASEPFRAAW